MDRDQILATLAERVDAHVSALPVAERPPRSQEPEPEDETPEGLVRTPGDAAHTLVEQLGSDDGFRFGLAAIDLLVRGLRPRELALVIGFAHSSKTQLVLTAITHNPDKRVLFLSLDDPAEMILLKLACIHHEMPGDQLESLIRSGEAKDLIQETVDRFPNLLIVDESMGTRGMNNVIHEAEQQWGQPPDLVVVDYLELLADVSGDGASVDDGVKAVAKRLKRKAKSYPFPLLVLHQNTRSRGAPGEPITMLSMAHGGEQEATVVIGVRRKRDNEKLEHWQRDAEANTVTLHVPKNKRPPAKITPPDGVDLFIDPLTGYIRPLREGDYRAGQARSKPSVVESAQDAVALARRQKELL